MLGPDLHLWSAGDDVHTGHVAVAKHPVACRQCLDAATATCDDVVVANSWVVRGRRWRANTTGEERRFLLVSVGTSAADSMSSAITVQRSTLLAFGQHFATTITH